MRPRLLVAVLTAAVLSVPAVAHAVVPKPAPAAPGARPTSVEQVALPIVFPVLGGAAWSDTFLGCRSGCSRQHQGQDLMAPKHRPLVAVFDGTVAYVSEDRGSSGWAVTLRSLDGRWTWHYMHLNNDTPGTDDGRGGRDYALAPGLVDGARVYAGQLVGWVGDSGNAESTGPHCHCELHRDGVVMDPGPSLRTAYRSTGLPVSGPHPDGTLVQWSDGPVHVVDGSRALRVSAGVLAANAWSLASVVKVSAREVRGYASGGWARPRDGVLLRDPTGSLALVQGGERVPLTDGQAAALGLRRPATLTAEEWARVPLAAEPVVPGPWHEGALVRVEGLPETWFVLGGVRRLVLDEVTLRSWGLTWADTHGVPAPVEPPVPPVEPPVPPVEPPTEPEPSATLPLEEPPADPAEPEQPTDPTSPTEPVEPADPPPGTHAPDDGPVLGLRDGTLAVTPAGTVVTVGGGQVRGLNRQLGEQLFGYRGLPRLRVHPSVLARLPQGPLVERWRG